MKVGCLWVRNEGFDCLKVVNLVLAGSNFGNLVYVVENFGYWYSARKDLYWFGVVGYFRSVHTALVTFLQTLSSLASRSIFQEHVDGSANPVTMYKFPVRCS